MSDDLNIVCLRCGKAGRETSCGVCVDCLMSDEPSSELKPGEGIEADDNF